MEERHGNFNCSNCGALAFRLNGSAKENEPQFIFAIKLEEERSRVEAPPQKILEQLRENSEKQRSELRILLPQNDTSFDERILQVRDTILELICEVGDCLKQSQLTIHLAVEYLDRYLLLRNSQVNSTTTTKSDNDEASSLEFISNLLGGFSADDIALTSLLLSSKFDEIDDNIPLIQELNKGHSLVRDSLDSGFLLCQSNERPRLTKNRSYPGFHSIQRCELYLLKVLSWDLNSITPLHFVQNHLYQGVLFTNDKLVNNSTGPQSPTNEEGKQRKALQKLRRHIDYFALQAIKQEFMLKKTYSDQTVAAAIIYAARKAAKVVENAWNEPAFKQMFGLHYQYNTQQQATSIADIQDCFNVLYRVYDKSHTAGTTSATQQFKSNSEVIVGNNDGPLNPFKIEINFQNLNNNRNGAAAQTATVETERATNLSTTIKQQQQKETTTKSNCRVITMKPSTSDYQGGLSTRGCEATNSDNSAVETLIQSINMTNNEEFSQNVENSQQSSSISQRSSTEHHEQDGENSSSSGIEESIEIQREDGDFQEEEVGVQQDQDQNRRQKQPYRSTKVSQTRSKKSKSKRNAAVNATRTANKTTHSHQMIKSQKQSNQKLGGGQHGGTSEVIKTATMSSKSSVANFDQVMLKPSFVNSQSEVAVCCSNKQSLSPIKEFKDRDGPIRVFRQKEQHQPQQQQQSLQLQNQQQTREPRAKASRKQHQQNSRERSDSSTSLFRLQPTMVRTSDVSLNKTATHTHLFLQPRAIPSDESQAKRNNCTQRSSSKQSTTPPNVLNFSSQNCKSGPKCCPPSRKSGEKGTLSKNNIEQGHQKQNVKKAAATFETKSDVSNQDLKMKHGRNSEITMEDKQRLISMSKSFAFPSIQQAARNKTMNTQQTSGTEQSSEPAEISEKFANLAAEVANESSDAKCTINALGTQINDIRQTKCTFMRVAIQDQQQQQRCTSALSQSKAPISQAADIGVNQQNGLKNNRDQNFIKRNINYVTKLDQKTKERKSLHASRSFIETSDNQKSIKPSIPYDANEQPSRAANDLQKYSEQAPKLSRYGAAKSLKRFSTAISKSQYMSNQVNETQSNANVQLITSTNVVTQKDETHQTTVTPKQVAYRPSKLFSKKQSIVGNNGNSSTNTSIAEQPRSSNPTKTALHKFKASHRTNSFGGVSTCLHSRNNQHRQGLDQSCSTQADTTHQLQTVSRDVSQTPLETSSANVSTNLLANKHSRPQNNHLKPTKSSLLRAKSSLGISAAEEIVKIAAASSQTVAQKLPCRAAVTTTMVNNEQVVIKFNNVVGGQSSTRAGSQSRLSQQSPQFGGLRSRKFQQEASQQVASVPIYTSTGCYGGAGKLEVDLSFPSAFITASGACGLAATTTTASSTAETPSAANTAHQTQRDRKSIAKSQTGPATRRHAHAHHQQAAVSKNSKQTTATTAKTQHQPPQSRESTTSQQAFRGTFSIR